MTTVAFLASLALIVGGVALVYVPAAVMVAGALLCALTVLWHMGGLTNGPKKNG